MFHNYEPTIDAPNDKSPSWYKSYHNSFYLCQLVNNLLLSYMKSYIELNEKSEIIVSKRQELIEKGILTIDKDSYEYINSEKIYTIAIESFLNELIENFKQTAGNINTNLFGMGLDHLLTHKSKVYLKSMSCKIVCFLYNRL